jgi:hypothetical protein
MPGTTAFRGVLKRDDAAVPVTFEAEIEKSGALKLSFAPIETTETSLKLAPRGTIAQRFELWKLNGCGSNGERFESATSPAHAVLNFGQA